MIKLKKSLTTTIACLFFITPVMCQKENINKNIAKNIVDKKHEFLAERGVFSKRSKKLSKKTRAGSNFFLDKKIKSNNKKN